MFSLTDYDYTLPDELIAQHPTLPPENARLLVYDRQTKTISDKHFFDLPEFVTPETLIVFNDSKVVKARILFPDFSGELLFLRLLTPTSCEALVRPGKKWKVWTTHILPETPISFTVDAVTEEGRILSCSHPLLEVLEQHGQMPLPPYITYDESDAIHYQPSVANDDKPWSVAAPTAALHFSHTLLNRLAQKWIQQTTVTLHVWIGTFKTVDVEDITRYAIHDELCEITPSLFATIAQQKNEKKPLLAIGTTSTRTLESLPYLRVQLNQQQKHLLTDIDTRQFWDKLTHSIAHEQGVKYVRGIVLKDETVLFHSTLYIYPWFSFRIIDHLITNFHLPKSSLLMLVAWYLGYDEMKRIYTHAIAQQYRFFSFWDGMLIL